MTGNESVIAVGSTVEELVLKIAKDQMYNKPPQHVTVIVPQKKDTNTGM